jgi:hypothetical protein
MSDIKMYMIAIESVDLNGQLVYEVVDTVGAESPEQAEHMYKKECGVANVICIGECLQLKTREE